ncbi:PucR family transcriptional regulator [Clostridium celatum]|uniref:Transcriptional regulator, Fis family n=1 Tax=Clostridium celatum DSM 1785 TaxID=545697 RepID=L1QF72_9CLOT|nr:helix-turn-helix domain-containing protein [Clostridium celatum]EKY26300.1 transcriptional regulator, Fis family [Clostridium celatum DSM 1785]MCE9653973.1 helix-turn-helix domain-containing protein [Clostridium celatum]
MKYIEQLVDEIYMSSNIPFQLIIDGVGEYTSKEFNNIQEFSEKNFNYKDTKCCIRVNAAFSITLNLLEFCIKEKLNEVFIKKSSIISLILKGQEVEKELVTAIFPEINKEFNLINIYIEKYNEEILFCIEESYAESNIEVVLYNKNILLIGDFEDVLDHAISIRETIVNSVSGKCYISYCNVENYLSLKRAYETSENKLKLAIKYKVNENIFDEKKLILESIIDSVSEDKKNHIYNAFNEGISKLDNEMIKTIDVFFKCGLNLSDAAKELYIHRNTLIYRLDKIQRYISYDIRDFNNAILVKILFFIWTEKNNFYLKMFSE